MAKKSGLGAALYLDGYDISGDVSAINTMRNTSGVLDVTGIDKSGHERIYSHVDGEMAFTTFFNDEAGALHEVLKAKGSGADRIVTFHQGGAIGDMAAGLVAKQVNYDGTRGADGSFTYNVQCLSSGYGLDFGEALTAGKRTDTTGTNGSGLDGGGATAAGLAAYLQVFEFTGTSVTVKVQMDDNSGFTSPTDLITFTAASGVTAERKATSTLTTAVERYLRVVTTGTFSNAVFSVCATRYPVVV